MRFVLSLALLVCSSDLLACGSPGAGSTGGYSSSTGGTQTQSDPLHFETGEFDVAAGETFECFYLDAYTKEELVVDGASGDQGPGGHHIVVYWTDVPHSPTHHACAEGEMVSWHQIAGAAGAQKAGQGTPPGGAEGLVQIPTGLGFKVPGGKQLVMQSHYINTTGSSERVNDWVTLHAVDPKAIKAYANYFALVDESFLIEPHSDLTSSKVCTVPQDLNAVLYLGHMHEFGKHYRMDFIDDAGKSTQVLYDKDWKEQYASHPPLVSFGIDAPLVLKKGQKIRQTCSWTNTTSNQIGFPREMCVGFFYYYPDAGEMTCAVE